MKKFLMAMFLLFIFATPLLAAEEGASQGGNSLKVALALASGFGIAIASFGGAFGQGRAVTAAMEGISRNPEAQERMFTPLILGLVFIESLVIYAFVVSILLQFKI